jgi:hypothetical protein
MLQSPQTPNAYDQREEAADAAMEDNWVDRTTCLFENKEGGWDGHPVMGNSKLAMRIISRQQDAELVALFLDLPGNIDKGRQFGTNGAL